MFGFVTITIAIVIAVEGSKIPFSIVCVPQYGVLVFLRSSRKPYLISLYG
jgi:hypothetical protein